MNSSILLDIYKGAFAAARRFRLSFHDAQDAAQDTVVRAMSYLAKGNTIHNPRSFGAQGARDARKALARRAGVVTYASMDRLERMERL